MKILVIQLGKIGDMILLTPVFSSLRRKFPDAEIHALAGRHNYSVLSNNPAVNYIHVYNKSPFKLSAFLVELLSMRFDYLIDPKDHDSTESHYLAKLIKADKKIGYHSEGQIYDYIVPSNKQNKNRHYTSICFNALEPLGIAMGDNIPKPEIFSAADSEQFAENYVAAMDGRPFVVINISASKADKMWQKEKWATVIQAIDHSSFNTVMTFADTEREVAGYIYRNCPRLNIYNSRNFDDVLALIRRSCAVISPDTSIVHAAAAYDKPLVALYNHNPMFFAKFMPQCTHQVIVRADKGKATGGISIARVIDSIKEAATVQPEFRFLLP